MDLSGKGVVITGASRGIGEATARAMGAAGAQVALLARNADAVAQIAGDIGPNALAIPCDVARYWEVEAALTAATNAFGSLDILINNAGVIDPIGPLKHADPDAWAQTIDINLKGVFNGMRAGLAMMKPGGTIITISSGAAHNALEGWSAYCTSKAGAAMLTACAFRENPGLRIMGLSPGTVATQMQREIKASGIGPVAALNWEDHIPADWPAQALIWMCSKDADEFNGTEISLRDEAIRARIGLTE